MSLAMATSRPKPMPMASSTLGDDHDLLWGQALKALRVKAGMTLAEAGDAVEPEAISGQGWSLYERGKLPGIHQPANQERLTRAVHASRSDLAEEARRLGADVPANENHGDAGFSEPQRSFVVPVLSRVRAEPNDHGGLVYDARMADATVDLGWLFAPSAGRLRMADDRLSGRVSAGQTLHFDRAQPPREGQVAVIETRDGGLHVYIFRKLTGGSITAMQTEPPATIEFPMTSVRGVYAVRLIGD